MKYIFSRKVLLLILFYSLDRFTHFSLRLNLPILLASEFNLSYSDMKVVANYLGYIPLFSYLIIGISFNRFRQAREIKLYLIPMIIGILILFINNLYSFFIGYSILLFIGPFIKIIVLLKIFDYLKSNNFNDDRAYVLMILFVNVFSFLSPIISGYLRLYIDLEWRLSLTLLNFVVWFIFGLLCIILPQEQNNDVEIVASKSNSYKIIIISLLGIISLSYFSKVVGSNLYKESEDFKPEMIRNIIQTSSLFICGIVFLFLPKLISGLKIKISTLIILIIGLISLTVCIVDISSNQNLILNIVTGLGGIFEILFYPALFFILINNFNYKYRAALLSVFYIFDFFVSDISGLLKMINQDGLISSILVATIIGFILVKYVVRIKAAHNNGNCCTTPKN